MYDIPSTTLNWETFKSYLLKNSGTTDDVKVSYVIEDKEFTIESQIDFQIALYSFRNRARLGEVITLRLERVATKKMKMDTSHMINAHTQVDPEMPTPNFTLASTPPDWFQLYMDQFKRELVDEVVSSVVGVIGPVLKQQNAQGSQHHRKTKLESTKRSRKIPSVHLNETGNEKECIKSLILEKKLESKLEKLEHKTMKIKEKKLQCAQKLGKPLSIAQDESDFEMDAATVPDECKIPHVSAGITYQHIWKVINIGNKKWNSKTELRYAWGSQLLIPVRKVISCPPLTPGKAGVIIVDLIIPSTPGHYECYWHFYHNNRRFGQWLGCQIVVDVAQDSQQNQNNMVEVLELAKRPKIGFELKRSHSWLSGEFRVSNDREVTEIPKAQPDQQSEVLLESPQRNNEAKNVTNNDKQFMENSLGNAELIANFKVSDLSQNNDEQLNVNVMTYANKSTLPSTSANDGNQINEKMFIAPKMKNNNSDDNCSSDSDNQSLVSFQDSISSVSTTYDDFIVVPMANATKKQHTTSTTDKPNNTENTNNVKTVEEMENKESDDNNNNTDNLEVNHYSTSTNSLFNKIESDSENVTIQNLPNELENMNLENKATEYAFVTYKGQKLAVPKKFLHSDYLATAEDAPDPRDSSSVKTNEINALKEKDLEKSGQIEEPLKEMRPEPELIASGKNELESKEPTPTCSNKEINFILDQKNDDCVLDSVRDASTAGVWSYASHCSAAGSCFSDNYTHALPNDSSPQSLTNSRLFVFPRNCPGYEVVYPCENCQVTEKPLEPTAPPVNYCPKSTPPYYVKTPSCYSYSAQNAPYPIVDNTSQKIVCGKGDEGYQSIAGNVQSAYDRRYFNVHETAAQAINESQGHLEQHIASSCSSPTPRSVNADREQSTVHILPETLVSGAVNVASSAINTARSVLNLIVPTQKEPGRWVNGHWVATNSESPREAGLRALAEMGFWNYDLNATLLARYNDDLARVVTELVK